jgi:hypothetical protein
MFTALLIRRIRPLAVALLTALTVVGVSLSAALAVTSPAHAGAHVAAMHWCGPGNPLCPPQINAAP